VPEDLLTLAQCRELLGDAAPGDNEEETASIRQSALALAEIITEAYADFRDRVEDFDPEEIRSSGNTGMLKLIGIELTDADFEDLDDSLGEDDGN
jgi:hypothetical protein